jgi:hypothetical protein
VGEQILNFWKCYDGKKIAQSAVPEAMAISAQASQTGIYIPQP